MKHPEGPKWSNFCLGNRLGERIEPIDLSLRGEKETGGTGKEVEPV
jgi:hypothetical protein